MIFYIIILSVVFVATVGYLKSRDGSRHEHAVIGEESSDLSWLPTVLAILGGISITFAVVFFL